MSQFKKLSESDLKKQLNDLQYKVTQEEHTEPPFKNAYWDNHEDGIYVDITTGEPLFTSKAKFDSGTGWPCFSEPLSKSTLIFKEDRKLWAARTEVRSKLGDSHLGHVFEDSRSETGARYCINSASLKFLSIADMKKDPTYSEWLKTFEET